MQFVVAKKRRSAGGSPSFSTVSVSSSPSRTLAVASAWPLRSSQGERRQLPACRRRADRLIRPAQGSPDVSTVAHREPLGVTHMEPVWRRDRIADTKMVSSLLCGVGAARAARSELLLGVFGAEALAGNLDEVRAVGQAIEGR